MRNLRIILLCLLLTLVLAITGCSSPAPSGGSTEQEEEELVYPEPGRPIEHIVGWAAGGGTDVALRAFLSHAEEYVGTKIYTKNIPGAMSAIGTYTVMKSVPDGYTIAGLTWDSLITAPYWDLVEGYDTDMLELICAFTVHPSIIAVHADSPWQTLDDFIEDAKARPGEISISNVGVGGVNHLPSLDMEQKLGLQFNHITYTGGSAPQRESLLSRETDAANLAYSTVAKEVEAGTIRVLGVMGEERDQNISDVPTFKELGYDLVWASFRGLAVPKGTPEEICSYLESKFEETFFSQKFQDFANETAMGQVWMNRQQFTEFIKNTQNNTFPLLDELVAQGVLERP
ncbi:MAG: tripartite tricarboxylate transporter substrate binding protein [bacterium]